MATRNTPTRLELHRLKYRRDGVTGTPLLRFNDLSVPERQLISNDIFTALHLGSGSHDPYDVVAEIFHSWGVMCTHPSAKRKFKGSGPAEVYRWFECEMCGCVVKNDEYSPQAATKKLKR